MEMRAQVAYERVEPLSGRNTPKRQVLRRPRRSFRGGECVLRVPAQAVECVARERTPRAACAQELGGGNAADGTVRAADETVRAADEAVRAADGAVRAADEAVRAALAGARQKW